MLAAPRLSDPWLGSTSSKNFEFTIVTKACLPMSTANK